MNARLILCRGSMAYLGRIKDNTPHRHHAAQLVLATGTSFRLSDGQCARECRSAVIPPNALHAVDSGDTPLLVLLADGPAVSPAGAASLDAVDAAAEMRAFASATPPCPRQRFAGLCGGVDPAPAGDPRVARVMALAAASDTPLRLDHAARHVGLSAGRLTHLFRAAVGISFKRWLLWERMLRAARRLAAEDDLTTVAHAAGFADSAHFSRSFRALFGATPAQLFRSRSVQVLRCPHH